MICVETGAGVRPKFVQTYSSTEGSRCSNVPTAPDIFPTEIVSTARAMRSADHGSHFMLFCANRKSGNKSVDICDQYFPCLFALHGECRIDDIAGCHAEMNKS